jgi:hypothetical protein
VQDKLDDFPVLGQQDLDESLIDESFLEDDDPKRFQEGRDGDHLMCPFQCEECHFINIKGSLPRLDNPSDVLLMCCMRRANLDSFWSRERSTVYSNLLEGKRFLATQKLLGINSSSLPPRGPFPKKDVMGMGVAASFLLRSKAKGQNANTIQFQTVRKVRSFFSNYSHACVGGMGASFTSDDGSGGRVSNSPTNHLWFQRFTQGCHRRMGDIWLPDRAVSRHELVACFNILEEWWTIFEKDLIGQDRVASTACILIAGYHGGLRGEEINRVHAGGMLFYWKEATEGKDIHIPLMLSGRFKKEVGEKYFCQPLAPITDSGRNLAIWFERKLDSLMKQSLCSGPMFKSMSAGKKMSISEMDELFHGILLEVQRRYPKILPDSVKITEEFSTFRSLRRGATSEAQNVKIPRDVIEANNRWRKISRAKGLVPGFSMMERYSDAKILVPTLTRFSQSLP